MELPLLEIAESDNTGFPVKVSTLDQPSGPREFCGNPTDAVPALPGPGQQYQFHFDMTRCIGCKCCVVACNEQNGNPADILWRRVGEIEGGVYPDTRRHYLSMGCNHCLEPTCMTGCPVNAYTKDDITGIVRHSADACIGCQYCTWNCSYGVPQYNPERGVVGKCDMCYGRLMQGQQPACAAACPENAIRIEVVDVDQWRQEYRAAANAPGMPAADDSISTTRITLPTRMPRDARKVDLDRVRLEQPHWPLIAMTVLTQFSVGAFFSVWLLQVLNAGVHRGAALAALAIASLALGVSVLHLGRPIHAMRALRMWRRSWLSREVLLFTLFASTAGCYSVALWFGRPLSAALGALTVLLGLGGVFASAKLYMVPGRPAWNLPTTPAEFFLTTGLLGSASTAILSSGASLARLAAITFGLAIFLHGGAKLLWISQSPMHELRGSARLLSNVLAPHLLWRFVLHSAGLGSLVFTHSVALGFMTALIFLAAEFIGRYIFFVSVVPKNMAAQFLVLEEAA